MSLLKPRPMGNIKLFENRQLRRYYDTEKDIWYFSVVDIVEALTESVNPTDYLKKSLVPDLKF